jgi:hypothetical protein
MMVPSLGAFLSMRFAVGLVVRVREAVVDRRTPSDPLHVREDLFELLVLILLELVGDLLGRRRDLRLLVGLDDERPLLLDPVGRGDVLGDGHERVARSALGVVVADVGDQRAGAIDLGRRLGDRARKRLDARRPDEAHDLLDAELLVAVVDAILEVGLHPLRERGDEAGLGGLVARQRRLVRQERKRRVLVRDAGVGLDDRSLGRRRGRRLLHLLDELGRDAVDDPSARVVAEDRERPGTFALGRVVAQDRVLEADALAVARAHADERQRGLLAEGPRVFVVRDDGVELLRAVLGRLPAMRVGFTDRAPRDPGRPGPHTRPEGDCRERPPTRPCHANEPLSHRALLLLLPVEPPPPRTRGTASAPRRRCYAGRRATGIVSGSWPPWLAIVASRVGQRRRCFSPMRSPSSASSASFLPCERERRKRARKPSHTPPACRA